MFVNSTFDPVEIEKERGVIKEELAMYRDSRLIMFRNSLTNTMPGNRWGVR